MRFFVRTSLAGLAVLSMLAPGAPGRAAVVKARLDDALVARLASATPAERLSVFVHADDVATARRRAREAGLTLLDTLDRIGVAVAAGTPATIRRAASAPGVTYLEADRPITFFTDTSHKATRGEEAMATITGADGAPLDGRGVSVAIIDTGVDGSHPDFEGRVIRNLKYVCSFLSPGNFCLGGSRDLEDVTGLPVGEAGWVDVTAAGNDSDTPSAGGHGTHVAGIVAGDGTASGSVFHGAAPGASIVSLSVGEFITIYGGAEALEWVLAHHDDVSPPIRVVNNSWGPLSPEAFDPEDTISKLSDALVADGVAISWAAGNAGDWSPDARTTSYGQNPTPGIVMVANYDDEDSGTRDGQLNYSSSRGAPGDPSTWPDISAPGTYITATCRPTLPICNAGDSEGGPASSDRYATLSGTSMAAPHSAGIMAQLFQADPSLTPAQVEDILEDTAYPFEFDYGGAYEPDPSNSDDCSSYDKGHGLVDVVAAAAAAKAGGSVGNDGGACPNPNAPSVVILEPADGADARPLTTVRGTAHIPEGQTDAGAPTTYYLHRQGTDCDGASLFIDTADTPGDLDDCTKRAVDVLLGYDLFLPALTPPPIEEYPAIPTPVGATVAGTQHTGTFYVSTDGPGELNFWVDLLDRSGNTSRWFGDGYGYVSVQEGGWHAVPVRVWTFEPHPIEGTLTLRIYVTWATTDWRWGHEGDHASKLDLRFLDPDPASPVQVRVTGAGFDSGPIAGTSDDEFETWEAPFDFLSLAPGDYTVTAALSNGSGELARDENHVIVSQGIATALALERTDTHGQDARTFYTATLTETQSGNPIAGRTIDFTVEGRPVGSAVTSAIGEATIRVSPQPRQATATATFAADRTYAGSSATQAG